LWSVLATLSVQLAQLPPFLLTGVALLIGSVPSWPAVWRRPAVWRVPPGTLALGVCGLFGYHFLLFMALRLAPPVEANLVNYLWPLFIVLLVPVLLPGMALKPRHVLASVAGFAGAAWAILGGSGGGSAASAGNGLAGGITATQAAGYLAALAAAVVWALYSVLTRRVAAFPTAAVGLFALISGVLALLCHAWLEPAVELGRRELWLLTLTGLGPLGAAFYLWDAALKRGDPRQIGVLSYLTPLASTAVLLVVTGQPLRVSLVGAALLIVGGAFVATRAGR
jgi:drug/metabolite transporter (DMT)-like permease